MGIVKNMRWAALWAIASLALGVALVGATGA